MPTTYTTYRIYPREIPGSPRTWTVIKVSDDGNTAEEMGEYATEDEARDAARSLLENDEDFDSFSDYHAWRSHKSDNYVAPATEERMISAHAHGRNAARDDFRSAEHTAADLYGRAPNDVLASFVAGYLDEMTRIKTEQSEGAK